MSSHRVGVAARTPVRRAAATALMLAFALIVSSCSSGTDSDIAQQEPTAQDTESNGADSGQTDEVAPDPGRGFDGPVTVVVANSPGTISLNGEQRVMAALIGDGPNAYLGGPGFPVTIGFSSVLGDDSGEVTGSWLTTNASALGLYVTRFDFPAPGPWEVYVEAEGQELGRTLIEVVENSSVPNIGDPAPPSETLTGLTVDAIAAISSDLDPDPSFYDLTIAEAVDNGRPTVIAFATPAFCRTALCGPTLEAVKAAVAGREDIDTVHVEPFDLELAPQGELLPIDAMFEWGIVTEPWVFVVDAEGMIAASFEGIIGQPELEAAIARL